MKKLTFNARKLPKVALSLLALLFTVVSTPAYAASSSITLSPMNQKIVVAPGDSISSAFTISNPGTSENDISYTLSVQPFYVDKNYNSVFNEPSSYSEIVDWITLDAPETGTLAPNQSSDITFTINVPENAPAGGQYAAIIATINSEDDRIGTSISEHQAIAHIVFTEITGETIKQGEITEASLPSFLLSGDITGTSTIKNTGNVHGTATYTMRVTSFFGGNEVYDNTDSPETHVIVPDRTFYNELTWAGTPQIGMFNVVYTVSFEGVTTEVSKLVIICPIWLILILAIAIIALIMVIIMFFRSSRR